MAETTTPEPGSPEAAALAHAEGQAIVQGAKKVDLSPSLSEDSAPAGKYKLIAREWHQLVSKIGEPRRFVHHKRGAIVTLESEDAERLLKHGAVAPTTAEQADSAAAQTKTNMDTATEVTEKIGQQRVNDPAAASS